MKNCPRRVTESRRVTEHVHTNNIQYKDMQNIDINKRIYCTKCLLPFLKTLNRNHFIKYSLPFPLYQRLHTSFDWIFNEFGRLLICRSIFARGSLGPGPGPGPQRAKTLRRLGKRSNPLNIQRENRWQRGKSTEYSLKRLRLRDLIKGKRDLVTICHCLCSFLLVNDRVAVYRNIRFLLQSALRAESSIENTTCESKKVTF